MAKVVVVYHSGTGHTDKMAQAVFQGVAAVEGVEASIYAIKGEDIQEGRWKNKEIIQALNAADGIIFGSPTYMGTVSAQMKAFMDATGQCYVTRKWVNKVAGAFTVAGSPSGDRFNTLTSMATYAMQLGMIWVGMKETPFTNKEGINRLGVYWGAAGQAMHEPVEEKPNEQDLKTGHHLGQRVAEVTLQLFATR